MDGYLLIGSINRKYIVKVRPFSSKKSAELKDYVKTTKTDFNLSLFILLIRTNDLPLEDSPETTMERVIETAEYLKAKTNNAVVFNIIARGDK